MMNTEPAYNQALDYLYSFVDYSLKKSSELARANFNLERMQALMARLGNPHQGYPIIHVAGTKGKGSTAALCASALVRAGHKTGLYTSPHLLDYTERIQVNGQPITHTALADLVDEIKPQVEAVPELTTFEITTAIGLLYFAQQGVDAAVIEVGLGGRLDATNVVLPRVSVITSLSYDHMAVLGNTLTQIAGEKAGIIKPGVPVVSAPQVEEALIVLERVARERGCPLILVGREVHFSQLSQSLDGQALTVEGIPLTIPLLGRHQVENAATAFAALRALGLEIPEQALRDGFASVRWPCRFEIARREPPLVFDSAHNTDSFGRLRQTLVDLFPDRPVILIMGVSEDKDLSGMLKEIRPCLERIVAIRADHPRALAPETIVDLADSLGIPAEAAASTQAALTRALQLAESGGEVVLSAGSMFATAEVKTAWQKLGSQ
jgi:dihydrofolate synthase/folylpolyglutamate synthase